MSLVAQVPGRRAGPRADRAGGAERAASGTHLRPSDPPHLVGLRPGGRTVKVLLIWCAPTPLRSISVRYERYVRGVLALGHDAVTVCLPAAAEGYGEPVLIAPNEPALRDPRFWEAARPDAAVVVTWLGLADVLGALRRACPRVTSLADSDGQIGARVHPRATFRQSILQHRGWLTRADRQVLAAAVSFRLGGLRRGAPQQRGPRGRDRDLQPRGADHLAAFFRRHRRPDLVDRIAVIPYPVDECYLHDKAPAVRERRLVAVGRWDDPQKDARLLAATIRRVLAADSDVGFDLIGPGGEAAFARAVRRQPRVVYHGAQPPEVVAGLPAEPFAAAVVPLGERPDRGERSPVPGLHAGRPRPRAEFRGLLPGRATTGPSAVAAPPRP